MAQAYYTYHIHITSVKTVQVQKRNPNNEILGEPTGIFACEGEEKLRIQELHQAAQEGKLADSNARELGEKLFNALFDDGLRNDFFNLYEQSRQESALLQIELLVDERDSQLIDVMALPWEFMCAPPKAGRGIVWLGTAPNLIFLRRQVHWVAPKLIQPAIGERLRIALAIASPKDREFREVRYEKIWQTLQLLASNHARQIELLGLVNPATPSTIDSLLEQKPHIFHFIGHGRTKDDKQQDTRQIALVETMLNGPQWLKAEEFGNLFNRYQPGVVLLQACEGAMYSTSTAFVSVASQISQQNIPIVVAMQYEVSNVTAQRFSLKFYERLAKGDPVDKAAQEGRWSISLGPTSYSTRDFATPVLFIGVKNGRLFLPPDSDSEDGKEEYRGYADSKEAKMSLQKVYERFREGRVIYQDKCEQAIISVEKLSRYVEQHRQNVTEFHTRLVLNHTDEQVRDLTTHLKMFHAVCPPSSAYREGRQYDNDRQIIENKFKTLLENLEQINNLKISS